MEKHRKDRCQTHSQTDRHLNQSISLSLSKVYFKFTRSQGRLQPAAHFVQGNSADPWAAAGDCPDANQEGEPIHRSTIRLDICILSICTPRKSANTYPPPPRWPPMRVAPTTPGPACVPAPHPPPLVSLSCPLLTLSGPATIPDPAPETGQVEFKVNVPFSASVCGLPCVASVRPLSDNHMHRTFFSCFLTHRHTHTLFFFRRHDFMTWRLSFLWSSSIVIISGCWLLFRHFCYSFFFFYWFISLFPCWGKKEWGCQELSLTTHNAYLKIY